MMGSPRENSSPSPSIHRSRAQTPERSSVADDWDLVDRLIRLATMLIAGPAVYWIYIVVTMEQTIRRNPVIRGPTKFGFGQVRQTPDFSCPVIY